MLELDDGVLDNLLVVYEAVDLGREHGLDVELAVGEDEAEALGGAVARLGVRGDRLYAEQLYDGARAVELLVTRLGVVHAGNDALGDQSGHGVQVVVGSGKG